MPCLVLLCLGLVASRARGDVSPASTAIDSVTHVLRAADSLAAFPPPRVRAWQLGLLRPDRMEHASLSFALASAFTMAMRDRAGSAALTFALGAGKEFWDSRHGGADAVDLAADAIGLGLSLLVIRGRAP